MDLTKRLGLPEDLLKQVTEVLEGKKISHPNQKAISTAAPPEDEITAADFKALKSKKKYKVEGFDRNKKPYESPIFESEMEALAFFNKIRKSAPLTSLEIVEVSEAVEEVKVDQVEEAKEVNSANAETEREHDCAKHVVHETWGKGETIPTMHDEPDTDGNIAWYDVMFEHGIEREVDINDLEIVVSESHKHSFVKRKKMSEAAAPEAHGNGMKKSVKKSKNPQIELNPDTGKMSNEEVEVVDEGIETSRKVAKMVGNAPSPHGDNPAYKPTKVPAELKKRAPTPAKPFEASKVKEEVELEEADTKVRGRFGGVNITHPTHGAFKAEYDPDAHTVDTPEAAVDIEVKHPDGKKSNLMMDHNGLKHQSGPKLPAEVHDALEKHAGKYREKSLVGTNKLEEEVELEEGRTKGRRQAVLGDTNHPDHEVAAAKFKELTGGKGNPGSYYHRENKYKDQADAAIAHAKKVASSGNSSSDASSDDSAEKHPHHELRSAADLPKGGKVAGQQVSQAQAKALDDRLNKMKPAERAAAYPKIRDHIAQIKKEIP